MPSLFLILAVVAIGYLVFEGGGGLLKTVMGYVKGEETPLQAASIGEFGCVLEKTAASQWLAMKSIAVDNGVQLKPDGPNSAFRTHEQQLAMRTARPGFAAEVDFSPHQRGIAVDVDLKSPDVLPWLQANAADYGWYPLPGSGAEKEPWHWEFHGITSSTLTAEEIA